MAPRSERVFGARYCCSQQERAFRKYLQPECTPGWCVGGWVVATFEVSDGGKGEMAAVGGGGCCGRLCAMRYRDGSFRDRHGAGAVRPRFALA